MTVPAKINRFSIIGICSWFSKLSGGFSYWCVT